MKTMTKLHELDFESLPHSPYSPDLYSSDFLLFSYLKRTLDGKKFNTVEEVIAETQAYFEAKDKSYKICIGKPNAAISVISLSNATKLNNRIKFYQENLFYVSLQTC